jgi:3-oxoacyl-[acyl-carrier-protein] synthase-3
MAQQPASRQQPVYLYSLGHFHPPEVLDNQFFNDLGIGSEASWIEDRTGIRERRSVLNQATIKKIQTGETNLDQLRQEGLIPSIPDMAEPAWKLLDSRLPTADLRAEALICGTSIPDYDIPANACAIAARMKWQVPAFDINSACSSFIVDLHAARGLLQSGLYRTLAIFNPERYSLRMNFNDRTTCVLFGDGCAAALVGQEPRPGSFEVLDTVIASDPEGYDLVKIPDGDFFSQNGKAVQKFAISRTLEITRAILDRNQVAAQDINYFTGHQANLRMVMSAAERLGLDANKHLYNVDQFGNQGAAGAPTVLSMNWDRFVKDDLIVMAVVGSGLTWGATLLRKT